jgi:hypothetical protein
MTATQTQFRRGTSAQCEGMTPAEGEAVVDLTNDTWRIGDGSRSGGFIMPNFNHIQVQSFQFAVAGGTSNAITLTISPAPLSYAQPLKLKFRATLTNTGAVTIDVNGLGVRNIQKVSGGSITNLSAGDIISGGIYEIVYDGAQFQLMTLTNAGIVNVSQGDLNTSTGVFSSSVSGSAITTNIFVSNSSVLSPGGQYGFSPEIFGSSTQRQGLILGTESTSYSQRYFGYSFIAGSQTVTARQRYITSSPPFDLGDGDVGGFVFLLLDSSGNIVSTYIADVPPWGYNGPTDIRCTHKCPVTGKKYRNAVKKLSVQDIMDGKKIEYEMQEITHEMKNADMGLIPHPFGNIPDDHRVIMLDPMSDKVARFIELQNAGSDEITEIVTKYISLDNDKIKRGCPKGVIPCKFKFKGR